MDSLEDLIQHVLSGGTVSHAEALVLVAEIARLRNDYQKLMGGLTGQDVEDMPENTVND